MMALQPSSLLDIGCGEGALLRQALERGCAHCVGIDPAALTAERDAVEIVTGHAESLPFADSSFDAVTLEYTAHHIQDLSRALREAVRVARRAVHILDPWYDVAIASQQTALDYDLWLKTIDRRMGSVHNPCLPPRDFIAIFQALGKFEIDFACRLVLVELDPGEVEDQARSHLSQIGDDRRLSDRLEEILDWIRLNGISDDGALLLTVTRP